MTLPFSFEAKTIIAEGRTTQENVDAIKCWLQTTALPQLQDEFIVIFLISTENQIDKTKETIEAYFRIRNASPNIFNNIDLESKEIQTAQKVLGICILPKRMDDNTAVVYGKLIDTDYRNADLIAGVKLCLAHLHLIQKDNPPTEIVLLCDMKGIGFMHLTCVKMDVVISGLKFLQEALPVRLRAIHILNINYMFDRLFSLFKMFINRELINLLHPHVPDMILQDFHDQWVPAYCLPKELGGDMAFEVLANETKNEIMKMQPFLNAEEQLRNAYKC